MKIKIKGIGLGKFARDGGELTVAEYQSARAKLDSIEFITEALLGVAQDILDCFDKRDLDCIEKEVERTKDHVETLAKRAPEDIRRKYLPLVIDSLDILLEDTRTDIRDGKAWEVIYDNYYDCLDEMLAYLCLSFKEL